MTISIRVWNGWKATNVICIDEVTNSQCRPNPQWQCSRTHWEILEPYPQISAVAHLLYFIETLYKVCPVLVKINYITMYRSTIPTILRCVWSASLWRESLSQQKRPMKERQRKDQVRTLLHRALGQGEYYMESPKLVVRTSSYLFITSYCICASHCLERIAIINDTERV